MGSDPPTSVTTRSTAERARAAFWWAAKLALGYAALHFILWHLGCRTSRTGVPRDPEDVVIAVIVMAIVAPAAAVLIAIVKPWCSSYLRCVLVAFLGSIPLYAAVLLVILGMDGRWLTMELLQGPLITGPILGWMLWQYAREGENWHWPFPKEDDDVA